MKMQIAVFLAVAQRYNTEKIHSVYTLLNSKGKDITCSQMATAALRNFDLFRLLHLSIRVFSNKTCSVNCVVHFSPSVSSIENSYI
jgi:hypothetical protein